MVDVLVLWLANRKRQAIDAVELAAIEAGVVAPLSVPGIQMRKLHREQALPESASKRVQTPTSL